MPSSADVLEFISNQQLSTYVGVEDFADKISFLFTVVVLFCAMAVVTVKLYLMKAISCYMSNSPGGLNIIEYIENYCWVEGTVPSPYTGKLPTTMEGWKEFNKNKILYYQWVPFVLGIQGIMFYVPRVIWQFVCYNRTGTDIQHIVTSANQAVHSDTETRQKMVTHLVKSLEQMLFQHRVFREGKRVELRKRIFKLCGFCMASKRLGTWLIFSYMALKMLYLLNAVGQVFLMQRFLGIGDNFNSNYTFFGVEILKNIIEGKDWESTMVFPRVGFCYAPIKQLGTLNSAVAQCALPANLLNEKIYVFLWFWILMVAIVTAISIPTWIIRMSFEKNRKRFIKKFLKLGELEDLDKKLIHKFTALFLRHDGIFLLRMISLNAGDIITAEIVCQLFKIFKDKYKNRTFMEGPGEEGSQARAIKLQPEGLSQVTNKLPTAPFDEENKITLLRRQFSSNDP